MADKSTHMRFMKENLSLILEEDMVSDTQKIMLMRVNLIKSFYMEQENGEMEMFTKELFSTTKCKLSMKLSIEVLRSFMMPKTIFFTKINYL